MNTSHKPPFTREQIRQLTQRSNWRGAWAVFSTWALIAASFALLATWTNPLTFIVALVLLGGRHLRGWRGRTAVRFTLAGFAVLVVAFFGSQLVLEVILDRA